MSEQVYSADETPMRTSYLLAQVWDTRYGRWIQYQREAHM